MKIGGVGKLQLEILKVLWAQPGATVQEVQEIVDSKRPLAYTTIATMLKKMEARGLVVHEKIGRLFKYQANVSQDEISDSVVGDVLNSLFSNHLPSLVNHLLDRDKVSALELNEIEKLITERKSRCEPPDRSTH
jgi:predicted transcriptional regulator